VRHFTDEAILDLLLLEEKEEEEEEEPAMGSLSPSLVIPLLEFNKSTFALEACLDGREKDCEQVSICTVSACRERG
jgi:hypothetical protein